MNCLHMIYREPLTSALLPAYITLSNSSLWTSPTWTLRSCLFVHSFLHTSQWANLPSWTVFTWTPRCQLLLQSFLHTSHWPILPHEHLPNEVLGPDYLCILSCIHHSGESSFMHSLHMDSKVLITSAALPAYITLVILPMNIFHIWSKHLLMKITNNYNFKIMFPIPSLSRPWEDIPLTQSFWTKFCPWPKLV